MTMIREYPTEDPLPKSFPAWRVGHVIAKVNYIARPWTITCSCGEVIAAPRGRARHLANGNASTIESMFANHRRFAPPEPADKRPSRSATGEAIALAAQEASRRAKALIAAGGDAPEPSQIAVADDSDATLDSGVRDALN